MNAIELFLADGKPANVYFCEKCRVVRGGFQAANECCEPPKCKRCGCENSSGLNCPSCKTVIYEENEKRRLNAAKKITVSDWDGWIYSDGHGDEFFSSVDEFMEWCDENEVTPPSHVYTADPVRFASVNMDDIIERFYDEAFDGFDANCLSGTEEFQTAINVFNQANEELKSYSVDFKTAILI